MTTRLGDSDWRNWPLGWEEWKPMGMTQEQWKAALMRARRRSDMEIKMEMCQCAVPKLLAASKVNRRRRRRR